VLDRASTFARPGIVSLLQTRLVPVALDQAYQRRQKDAEGEFYRRIAGQGPRHDFEKTTQGFYLATASGKLLLFNNSRDPEKLERMIREKLAEFETLEEATATVDALEDSAPDPRWNPRPPEGGLIVRVRARVMGGYEPTDDRWRSIFQNALSRDTLWITAAEHRALVAGEILPSLSTRIARFHLVDNTRGEPPMWEPQEIESNTLRLEHGVITGGVRLRTAGGDRSYDARVRGRVETRDGVVTRFDLVAFGDFSGRGPFTPNPPPGLFPLAVSFSLADGGETADRIPPQGARGWLDGYLGAEGGRR